MNRFTTITNERKKVSRVYLEKYFLGIEIMIMHGKAGTIIPGTLKNKSSLLFDPLSLA